MNNGEVTKFLLEDGNGNCVLIDEIKRTNNSLSYFAYGGGKADPIMTMRVTYQIEPTRDGSLGCKVRRTTKDFTQFKLLIVPLKWIVYKFLTWENEVMEMMWHRKWFDNNMKKKS